VEKLLPSAAECVCSSCQADWSTYSWTTSNRT